MSEFPPDNHRPPMTQEQLEWISRQTSRAVNKAVENAMRVYSRVALSGFIILLLGLALTVTVMQNYDKDSRKAIVDSGRAVSVAGCNRDFESISRDRTLLARGRANLAKQHDHGEITDAAFARGDKFYEDELRNYQLPDCREALNLLTDNPDEPIYVPEPRYQGDGKG